MKCNTCAAFPLAQVRVVFALALLAILAGGCPAANSHTLIEVDDSQTLTESIFRTGTEIDPLTLAAPGETFNLDLTVDSPDAILPEDISVVISWECSFGGGSGQTTMNLSEAGLTQLTGSWSGQASDGGQLTCVDSSGQKRPVLWHVEFFRVGTFTEEATFSYEIDYREADVN